MKKYFCPICNRKMRKRIRYSRSKRKFKRILWCNTCYDWVYTDKWEQFVKRVRF